MLFLLDHSLTGKYQLVEPMPFLRVKTSTSLHSLNFPKFQLVIPYNVFLINKIACINLPLVLRKRF